MPYANSKSRIAFLTGLLLLGILQSACGDRESGGHEVSMSAAPKPATATAPIAPVRQNRGVARSVRIGGGYSYIEVDLGDASVWLATSVTAVSPGDEIAWNDHAVMTNFKSQALNRTFDRILFVDRIAKRPPTGVVARRGIVTETMAAAGYSFIRVDENGASVWLAAPQTSIEVGQVVEWSGGSLMRKFNSRSLQRVFDEIIFVGSVQLS